MLVLATTSREERAEGEGSKKQSPVLTARGTRASAFTLHFDGLIGLVVGRERVDIGSGRWYDDKCLRFDGEEVEDGGTSSAYMPCRSGVYFPASFVRRCAVCAVCADCAVFGL